MLDASRGRESRLWIHVTTRAQPEDIARHRQPSLRLLHLPHIRNNDGLSPDRGQLIQGLDNNYSSMCNLILTIFQREKADCVLRDHRQRYGLRAPGVT